MSSNNDDNVEKALHVVVVVKNFIIVLYIIDINININLLFCFVLFCFSSILCCALLFEKSELFEKSDENENENERKS
jgi:hypothetical protein